MTDLSITILSYNTKALTVDCVKSVLRSLDYDPGLSAEVIILDNNSSDGSVEALEKIRDSRIRIISHKENTGYGRGNNIAAQKSHGDKLLFLNSDTLAIKDAIPQLYNFFTEEKRGKDFDFAGARLLNKDQTPQASCGRFYTLPVAFAALFLKGDSWGASRWPVHAVQKVDWVSGAAFITKKSTFDSLGGFDDSLFMYWDEIDLFYRASQKKLKVGTYPDATFIHLEGASSESRTQPILKVFQGYIYFYRKHSSPLQLRLLKYMLQLKALVALIIGKITGNRYLIDTYQKAYETAQKN